MRKLRLGCTICMCSNDISFFFFFWEKKRVLVQSVHIYITSRIFFLIINLRIVNYYVGFGNHAPTMRC